MNGSRWDTAGVPHKGWTCIDGVGLRTNGEPADEADTRPARRTPEWRRRSRKPQGEISEISEISAVTSTYV